MVIQFGASICNNFCVVLVDLPECYAFIQSRIDDLQVEKTLSAKFTSLFNFSSVTNHWKLIIITIKMLLLLCYFSQTLSTHKFLKPFHRHCANPMIKTHTSSPSTEKCKSRERKSRSEWLFIATLTNEASKWNVFYRLRESWWSHRGIYRTSLILRVDDVLKLMVEPKTAYTVDGFTISIGHIASMVATRSTILRSRWSQTLIVCISPASVVDDVVVYWS